MVKAEKIPEGYRATEAGILPVDWQVKRLSEIATELTERAGQDMYETVSISAGIGFVNQAEKFGKELSGKQYEKYIVLHKGDFSYNKGNSKTSPQGCIYRLNDRESAAVPNVFESFRIKEQDTDYYEQLFLSGFLNRQLYSRINRGVRDDGLLNLTGKDFYSCTVPVPPVDEQKKIAEVLLCCDRVINLKQQLIVELQRLKSGFLQAMFPAKGHSEPDIRFPEFSDAWEQRKLGELVDVCSGRDYKHLSEGDIPVYGTGGYMLSVSEALSYDKDAIGIGRKGTIDKPYILNAPFWTVDTLFYAIPKEKVDLNFAFDIFQNINWKKKDESTGVPSLSRTAINEIHILVPQYDEQQVLGQLFYGIDRLIALHQRELEETKKKKKSLAKLLLTGSVRVPT